MTTNTATESAKTEATVEPTRPAITIHQGLNNPDDRIVRDHRTKRDYPFTAMWSPDAFNDLSAYFLAHPNINIYIYSPTEVDAYSAGEILISVFA